jgi:outer membrane murein-binding lipoprotein Lpp
MVLMMKSAVVGLLLLTGCAQIGAKVIEIAGDDLKRTSELAAKYGKPEVQQCADFLVSSIGGLNADQASLDALLQEDTQGIFSGALKAVLVKEYLTSLNDPARADAFKKAFDTNCKAVAGQILLNIIRDASKIGQRRGL